jgi:hypothetical protein
MANKSGSASADDARKAASGPKGQSVRRIEIGGKEFWKGEVQEKGPAGKMRNVYYAAGLNGYVLQFTIVSFDVKLGAELEHSIEAITFFDTAKAEEAAGSGSRAYNPAASHSVNTAPVLSSNRIGQLNPGVVSGSTYTNDALGFRYEFPSGWAVNDKATQDKTMEAGHEFAWGDSSSAAREHESAQHCARVLLFVTKYPEGMKTEELNPLIVVLAADSTCFPRTRFPTAADDTSAIQQVAQQFVRSLAGTPFVSKGQNSVKAFTVAGHVMLDISGSFAVNPPGHSAPLDIFTSIVFTEAKDYWIAWGFMSGSQTELQELKKTKISLSSQLATVPAAQ